MYNESALTLSEWSGFQLPPVLRVPIYIFFSKTSLSFQMLFCLLPFVSDYVCLYYDMIVCIRRTIVEAEVRFTVI